MSEDRELRERRAADSGVRAKCEQIEDQEMRFNQGTTIGQLYEPAMKITDEVEAKQYLEDLIEYGMSYGQSREEAQRIQRANLGYFAGYYDHETRLRVERLFSCRHPIFGKAENGPPTVEQAFAAGKKIAENFYPPAPRKGER